MALSKQFLLRVTPEVYEALANKAKSLDGSVNLLLNKIIKSYLANDINLEVSPEIEELNERVTAIEAQLTKIKPLPLYLMEQ
jgi:hypothetical protein